MFNNVKEMGVVMGTLLAVAGTIMLATVMSIALIA